MSWLRAAPEVLSIRVEECPVTGDALHDSTYVLPLTKVTRLDRDRVGEKAATLGELMRAGFAVPEEFVARRAAG